MTTKRRVLSVLGVLLILILTTTVAYAADIVTNGDFSSLTGSQPDYWTPWYWEGDTIVADGTGACGAGVATIEGVGIATAQQCIHLTSHGTSWTFSADMAVLTGFASASVADFYTTADCSGSYAHREQLGNATTSSLQHFSTTFVYDTAANSINSVLVGIETGVSASTVMVGCFDNVSLSADGATDVTLRDVKAKRTVPLLLIGILLGSGITLSLLVPRRKKLFVSSRRQESH